LTLKKIKSEALNVFKEAAVHLDSDTDLEINKKGGDQWRIQKIFSGGATMDRVKLPLLSKNY
jgi:hypothetical protein